jgi:hypothetical protein
MEYPEGAYMAFTTWSELAAEIRADLASKKWRTKSYEFDGMRREFVSPVEILKWLAYVESRADGEKGGEYYLRTCARAAD